MFASRRTEIQVAFLVMGIIVWGYGLRIDNEILEYSGIVFFAAATLMRLFKPRDASGQD